ncbi:uncharacterized protein TNCV_92671 [Trichonephila clavipes]|nr:uncharacterized protein TNCV_92671 [Trichonephila clavipes]
MDDPICYELREISIATSTSVKCYSPKSFPSFKASLEFFQQDDARPHVGKTVQDFCSAQHMQLLPWPTNSPNISPIEHVWGLVGQRLVRDPRPAALKDEICCAYKQYGILFHKQTFKICLTACHIA